MASTTKEQKLNLLGKVIPDIRQLKQVFVANDVGILTDIRVLFLGDSEPTLIKVDTIYGGLNDSNQSNTD